METLWRILEFLLAATAGGLLSRLLTIRARVKSENANAAQAEAEAKAVQIENIRKIVDEIYEPAFKNLNKTVSELRAEVEQVRDEKAKLREEFAQMKDEYDDLKEDYAQLKEDHGKLKEDYEKLAIENENFRRAIREINPEAIPSKRSENAQSQPRNGNGQFTKREG